MTRARSAWARRLLVAALAMVVPRSVAADPVAVKVIDVAGDVAYVSPGRAAGIVPGTMIRIGGVELDVLEVTEQTAVVRIKTKRVAIGDTGTANVTPSAAVAVKQLPAPRPQEAFVGQWVAPELPATQQQPTPVSLGSGRRQGRIHLAMIGKAFGAADRSSIDGDVEGRVIASFDLMTDRPLAADLDAAGRFFFDGYGTRSRSPAFVRAAQLRYGDAADPRFALGRLRYAASTVGMLDGGRASARVGTYEIAAFGGLVPDPLSGKPDTSAARFGAELAYDDATATWQPRIALAAHGSTWEGEVDERRFSLVTSASRDALRLDGWAELQSFPSGNQFDAKALELTGAGATAQWREHGRHVGVDVTYLKPERSLRLAAVLPREWLCTPIRVQGDASDTCGGISSWTSANASAGIGSARWSVDGIGSVAWSDGVYRGFESSGYLRGELHLGPARAEAAVSAGKASFASWTAGEVGGGYAPTRRLDVSVRYRPELLDYVGSTGPMLLHSIIADGRYSMSTELDLSLSAMGTTGEDRDALALLAVIVWRPFP